MARLIIYYAHPGQRFSHANAAMVEAVRGVDGITFVDLYTEYPRHNIDVDREQARLLEHDAILLQFPLFWYSAPSLLKEWIDLVLEHGFAYGHEGTHLAGKTMMLAVTAGGSEEAYTPAGYQYYPIRTFLTPFEQTARLCQMAFPAPYVLYGSIAAQQSGDIKAHAAGYARLLAAVRDDRYDFGAVAQKDVITHSDLSVLQGI